jgi:putative acetyltransferase
MDKSQGYIEVVHAPGPTDEVRALVTALEDELAALYSPEQRHGLKLDAIFQPHIRFFVARLDGEPMGCGGIAFFEGFAEVKRMYVRPKARGRGIADAIIAQIEAETRAKGLAVLKLEGGTQSYASHRFYARMGFRPCAPFEPYASMPAGAIATSIFLEKTL